MSIDPRGLFPEQTQKGRYTGFPIRDRYNCDLNATKSKVYVTTTRPSAETGSYPALTVQFLGI